MYDDTPDTTMVDTANEIVDEFRDKVQDMEDQFMLMEMLLTHDKKSELNKEFIKKKLLDNIEAEADAFFESEELDKTQDLLSNYRIGEIKEQEFEAKKMVDQVAVSDYNALTDPIARQQMVVDQVNAMKEGIYFAKVEEERRRLKRMGKS